MTFFYLFRATIFLLLSSFFSRLSAERITSVPAIFVFGDSSADVGNNNYIPSAPVDIRGNYPHYGIDFPSQVPTGRFSNGYIGVDYLAKAMGFEQSPQPYLSLAKEEEDGVLQGVNFASGGSGILDSTGSVSISLKTQIEYFEKFRSILIRKLGERAASLHLAKSLFFVGTGGNDLIAYYTEFGPRINETMTRLFISSLGLKFEQHLKKLYGLGPRKFGLYGQTPIGCAPALKIWNPSRGCMEDLNACSLLFNRVVRSRLDHLSSTLPGFKYSHANLYNSVVFLLENPDVYGFRQLESSCCGSGVLNAEEGCSPHSPYCHNREEYYFWDKYHPTQRGHEVLAMNAYNGSKVYAAPINIKQLVESGMEERNMHFSA
ncbi:hypothetical protein HPP92_014129 [Vanilla planifolia]|uniref:Uncharacterized protein n=1 Tax=Vanilla planifolia TaxID=51239 RepID=A0A835UUH3_VANPL|nr:hypothetical protein HPP92_014129 [Vanilla planifolia]